MKVWVTRDEPPDGPLSTALRGAGLDVVLEPVIEKRVVGDPSEAIRRLGPNDWLVLTSPYAIEAVVALVGDAARIPRVAVVAEPSRRAAEDRGLRVELVGPGGTGKSLFRELRAEATRGKVCYPRSSLAAVPEPWPGVELDCPVLYETCTRAFSPDVVTQVDVLSVASPSAVRAVGPLDLPFASIGPTTSAAIREIGREPWVESPSPSFESLASAIVHQADQSSAH
ncbi:MAG: uroporphyrinogen-III synthase [Phycisphaerae bacterium]|nr:uroporphyrinogen-III synthase [Phycisphaerae bacterium]